MMSPTRTLSTTDLFRALTLLLAAAALLVPTASLRAQEAEPAPTEELELLPAAEDVLERFFVASGGRESYGQVHNRLSKGTIEMTAMGMSGGFTSYQAEPNLMSTVLELGGMATVAEGTNGEIVWEVNSITGPRLKEDEELAVALRRATFHLELHWKELYSSAVTAGVETVGDRECYKLVLRPVDGAPETWYFDTTDYLLRQVAVTEKTPMGDVPASITLDGYKEVLGVLVPHKSVMSALGMDMIITLDTVEHNVEIPEGTFDPPEEILALLEAAEEKPAEEDEAAPTGEPANVKNPQG